jgi:hypothetical protein
MSNPTFTMNEVQEPNIDPEPGYMTPAEESTSTTKKKRPRTDPGVDDEIVKTTAFKKEVVSPMKENKYTVPNKDPVFHTVFGKDYDIESDIHHHMDMYLSQDIDGFSSDVTTPAKLIHAITYTIATHNNRIKFHNQQIQNKDNQLPKFKLDDLTGVVTNYFTENVALDYQTGLNDIESGESGFASKEAEEKFKAEAERYFTLESKINESIREINMKKDSMDATVDEDFVPLTTLARSASTSRLDDIKQEKQPSNEKDTVSGGSRAITNKYRSMKHSTEKRKRNKLNRLSRRRARRSRRVSVKK